MAGLFCTSPQLCTLERQMQQPPGYRPKGQGIYIVEKVDWKSRGNYKEIIDCVISCMQMENLKRRIKDVYADVETEMIFRSIKHRNDFNSLMYGKRGAGLRHTSGYAAAAFLLSADEELWDRVHKNVLDRGIYFDRIKIGRVSLEQYILFHAAKDVYTGTKHLRISELADRELIPDGIFRLIINAFVIEKCGVEIVEQEVWYESQGCR